MQPKFAFKTWTVADTDPAALDAKVAAAGKELVAAGWYWMDTQFRMAVAPDGSVTYAVQLLGRKGGPGL